MITNNYPSNLTELFSAMGKNIEHDYYLKKHSRTFYLPIQQLPPVLKETVTSSYLSLRAIDEIEDNPNLEIKDKVYLLNRISEIISEDKGCISEQLEKLYQPYNGQLPKVTLKLVDWIQLAPPGIQDRIIETVNLMSLKMSYWARREWTIHNAFDLEHYIYSVAGIVGILLGDLWSWHNGIQTDRGKAVIYGKSLQLVNILLNENEDKKRGVNFIPPEMSHQDLFELSQKYLLLGYSWAEQIQDTDLFKFTVFPLEIAKKATELYLIKERLVKSDIEKIHNSIYTS